MASTQIAFFGHDAGHRQITRRRGASQVLGLVSGNLLNGLSYTWWIAKHNAHHAHLAGADSNWPRTSVSGTRFSWNG